MLTNTYKPHLSGVARSIETYSNRLRRHGHRVVVVAPEYPGAAGEDDVYRVPSITNSSGYSIPLTVNIVKNILSCCTAFLRPDVIHSHHPILLGDVAVDIGRSWNIPVVFTYHTMPEEALHHANLPEDLADVGKIAAISKSLSYCSKVDHIVAPSSGICSMLRSRNVRKPISVIPTGIDELVFNGKNREATRRRLGIGPSDYIIGHVGRLTKEKNLTFLFNAVRQYLDRDKSAKFLLVGGQGPDIAELLGMFNDMRGSRFIYVGIKRDSELADIYSAMDCFVFSSKVETQGMVLAEAMLCGVPVVAISSTGVNDIVKNGMNGFGTAENYHDFISAIYKCKKMDRSIVSSSAFYFTIEICISKLLGIYREFAKERRLAFGMKTLIGKLIGK